MTSTHTSSIIRQCLSVCVKLLAKTFKRDFRLWRVRRCMTTICFHLCKPHSLSLSQRQVLIPLYLFGRPKYAACRINHVVCILYAFILNAAVAAKPLTFCLTFHTYYCNCCLNFSALCYSSVSSVFVKCCTTLTFIARTNCSTVAQHY